MKLIQSAPTHISMAKITVESIKITLRMKRIIVNTGAVRLLVNFLVISGGKNIYIPAKESKLKYFLLSFHHNFLVPDCKLNKVLPCSFDLSILLSIAHVNLNISQQPVFSSVPYLMFLCFLVSCFPSLHFFFAPS